jgi:hypothetical protein
MVDALNNEGVEHHLKRINLDPEPGVKKARRYFSRNTLRFFSATVFHRSSWRIMLKFCEEDEFYKKK